jgi:KDO2-lipid IV(A) lauroyltransferase
MSLRYAYFRTISFLSLTLPRPVAYWVAHRVADFNYFVDARGRRAVHDNLRVILGPQAPERRIRYEARWVFRHFGEYMTEFFGYQRFGAKFIDTYVDLIGKEHLDEALAKGRGAIMVTAHFSNWEIGAALLARKGYELMSVAQMHPEPDVNELFRRQRASRGYYVIPIEGAYRRSVQWLKENKVVCFVGERNVVAGGDIVQFFGRPCLFPQGPARIALATGAPLLPGFVIRRANNSFAGIIEPPIPVPEKGSRRERGLAMTQAYARVVEEYIRRFPALWGVFFRVWNATGKLTPEEQAAAIGPQWGRGTIREDSEAEGPRE